MMCKAFSILLVFVLVVQAIPVSAQDVDSDPTLEERLRNMDVEVERFVDAKGSTGVGIQYLVHKVPSDTLVKANLHDGRTVTGRLKEVNEKGFILDPGQFVACEEVATLATQGFASSTNYKGILIVVGAILVIGLVLYLAQVS